MTAATAKLHDRWRALVNRPGPRTETIVAAARRWARITEARRAFEAALALESTETGRIPSKK